MSSLLSVQEKDTSTYRVHSARAGRRDFKHSTRPVNRDLQFNKWIVSIQIMLLFYNEETET